MRTAFRSLTPVLLLQLLFAATAMASIQVQKDNKTVITFTKVEDKIVIRHCQEYTLAEDIARDSGCTVETNYTDITFPAAGFKVLSEAYLLGAKNSATANTEALDIPYFPFYQGLNASDEAMSFWLLSTPEATLSFDKRDLLIRYRTDLSLFAEKEARLEQVNTRIARLLAFQKEFQTQGSDLEGGYELIKLEKEKSSLEVFLKDRPLVEESKKKISKMLDSLLSKMDGNKVQMTLSYAKSAKGIAFYLLKSLLNMPYKGSCGGEIDPRFLENVAAGTVCLTSNNMPFVLVKNAVWGNGWRDYTGKVWFLRNPSEPHPSVADKDCKDLGARLPSRKETTDLFDNSPENYSFGLIMQDYSNVDRFNLWVKDPAFESFNKDTGSQLGFAQFYNPRYYSGNHNIMFSAVEVLDSYGKPVSSGRLIKTICILDSQ